MIIKYMIEYICLKIKRNYNLVCLNDWLKCYSIYKYNLVIILNIRKYTLLDIKRIIVLRTGRVTK